MSIDQYTSNTELEKMTDTGLALADASLDVRSRKVIDRDGDEIGHVSHLFIDRNERKVRMLEVRAGGFFGIGERHFLLPVDAITNVANDEVRVNQTRAHVAHSPVYDPDLVEAPTQESWAPLYGYYGFAPYWSLGYNYPQVPISVRSRDFSHD